MGNIGATEILLILLIALLVFGAGRIADVFKGVGTGIRLFKKGLREDDDVPTDRQLPPSSKPPARADDDENKNSRGMPGGTDGADAP